MDFHNYRRAETTEVRNGVSQWEIFVRRPNNVSPLILIPESVQSSQKYCFVLAIGSNSNRLFINK